MSDTFDYWEEGMAEAAEKDFKEWEFQRRQKDKAFKSAVAAEVKRQLANMNSQALKQTDFADIVKAKPRGATKTVNCKCCGKPFAARVADLNRGWTKFCSKSCKAKNQESKTFYFRNYKQCRPY